MLPKWIEVTNTDAVRRTLTDLQLPNGRLDFEPGFETSIPTPVWNRRWRTPWLKRAGPKPVPAEVIAKQVEELLDATYGEDGFTCLVQDCGWKGKTFAAVKAHMTRVHKDKPSAKTPEEGDMQ